MSKAKQNPGQSDEMLREYDFSHGVRGKHYRAYQQGHTVTVHHPDGATTIQEFEPEPGTVVLAPDVREYFPDAQAVNEALRGLIALVPDKKRKGKND
jgi:hypothetical protein